MDFPEIWYIWTLYHNILHEKKNSKKVNFSTRYHEKLKKVAIFSKKREKREKAIFFFKNGEIDPKICKIEVPQ